MQVGDLVRETVDGYTGIIVDWAQDGWLVHFPEYNCIFHVKPSFLEVVKHG